jgi:gamma-glutamylcyclotransferase (GGCT)/AIG2-like uncharacterized protein YtfP
MPKSKTTDRARRKKVARSKRKLTKKRINNLHQMVNALEEYAGRIQEEVLEIDGEVYLTPEQEQVIAQMLENDKKKEG